MQRPHKGRGTVADQIAWCREMQAWALSEIAAGAGHQAVLGLSDALSEELLIEAEEAHQGNHRCEL